MAKRERLKQIFPRASSTFLELNSQVPNAGPECDKKKSLGGPVPGKAKSLRRIGVCFTLHRKRLLDDDSAAASVKDLLDGLRHAGLLQEDDPGSIALTTQQEKVGGDQEETVTIDLTYPCIHSQYPPAFQKILHRSQ